MIAAVLPASFGAGSALTGNCCICHKRKQKLEKKFSKKVLDIPGGREYNGKAVAQESTAKTGLGQQMDLEKRTA
ncbi:MAG: hypothetical protein II184_07705 [Clostridia bacterium]|nr:hypothetical protein [Clostridia bacterium]